ncbi:hypothetical protein V6N11_073722 [Hibiscus sabdariffa]|uniref:Reverse transcriptase Ty1/copia-type domain-containing protein n=1 Tax=Hibiscus sabdariffa TaxID=183260 RepID=A0ABR2ADX2_9ROSI
MDVKTAFLNAKLEEDVYITKPEGFVTPENAGKVCKLQRSIYGLKQASRSWNLRFNDAIKEFGFIRNEDESCVYKKFSGSIVSFLILIYERINQPRQIEEASESREKFVERNIYLFDVGRVKLKKRMNAVHVRDQKHELTLPRNRDKPITEQDALPRSEGLSRYLPGQDPLSLTRHPLCHPT